MKTKIDKALEMLIKQANLRQVYDYNLKQLISVVEDELAKRDEKRANMIKCLEDMCKWLQENGKTEHTFYYSAKSPKELMEAGDDCVTDEGFNIICQQTDKKEKMTFAYGENIFRVNSYIEIKKMGKGEDEYEERKGEFKMEEILAKVEKRL